MFAETNAARADGSTTKNVAATSKAVKINLTIASFFDET